MEKYCNNQPPHRLTQDKEFVPKGTHPNSAFERTSFMLETLDEMVIKMSLRALAKGKGVAISELCDNIGDCFRTLSFVMTKEKKQSVKIFSY